MQDFKKYIFVQYYPKTYYVSKIFFHRRGRYKTSIRSSQVFISTLACLNPVQQEYLFFQICSKKSEKCATH